MTGGPALNPPLPTDLPLVDGHLDLAENVTLFGRDLTLPVAEMRTREKWRRDHSIPVSLRDQLQRHAEHIARLVGWSHVGIGSDLDGGFGREESPLEIDTIADLYKVGEAVPPETRQAVVSANWLRFLREALPR